MNEITIIYDVESCFEDGWNSLYCSLLKTNLELSKIPHELIFVYNNESNLQQFKTFVKLPKAKFVKYSTNISQGFNIALRNLDTQFACFLPADIHLEASWLYDLLFYSVNIENTGVTSICSTLTKGYKTPLEAQNNATITAYIPDYISHLAFVNFSIIDRIGAFDENLHYWPETISNYADRAFRLGLINYNIPYQHSIQSAENRQVERIKNKIFIPLHTRSQKEEQAFNFLDSLALKLFSNLPEKFENKSTASFGLTLHVLSESDIEKIKEFAATFDLTFFIGSCQNEKIKVTFLTKI